MLIRAFVAIELSPEIRRGLEQILTDLQKAAGNHVRWVNPGNIHLTLKFLGESAPKELSLLSEAIHRIASTTPPLIVEVNGMGVFPNPKRPRVIWVGVQATSPLFKLQEAVETAAEQIGYPREERPFSPHLTLGRVRRETSPADLARLGQLIGQKSPGSIGSMTVNHLTLFRSDLKPDGAIYTPLARFSLSG
ncbi:MAG: RNA 2',3'-cyclic phosphodiesterase [Chloroflexota bacterium]